MSFYQSQSDTQMYSTPRSQIDLEKRKFSVFQQTCESLQLTKSVTEKKQLISKLTEFLNDSTIIQILDTNTKSTSLNQSQYSRKLEWNSLFQIVQKFIIHELSSVKDKQSSTQSSSVDSKTLHLRSIMSLILNQINSRGVPNLELDLFLEMYRSMYNLTESDGSAHQVKLLNDFFYTSILSFPKYCAEMKKNDWMELMNIYSSNYLKSICSAGGVRLDPGASVKCLRKILSNSNKYIGVFSNVKLFAFFNLAILNIKIGSNPELVENLIGSLVELCFNFENECMFEICKLGVEVTDKLVEIYSFKTSNQSTKDLILRFIIHQFKMQNITKELNPECFGPWMTVVRSINESFVEELESICFQKLVSKSNKSSMSSKMTPSHAISSDECKLSEILAKCFIHLIENPSTDHSQQDSNFALSIKGDDDDDDDKENSYPTPKRRKLDRKVSLISSTSSCTWPSIVEKLEQPSLNSAILSNDAKLVAGKIAWLMITEQLAQNHFQKIPSDVVSRVADSLLVYLDTKTNQSFAIHLNKIAFRLFYVFVKNGLNVANALKWTQLCLNSNDQFDLLYELNRDSNEKSIELIVKRFIHNIKNANSDQTNLNYLALLSKLRLCNLNEQLKQTIIDTLLSTPDCNDDSHYFSDSILLSSYNNSYLLMANVLVDIVADFECHGDLDLTSTNSSQIFDYHSMATEKREFYRELTGTQKNSESKLPSKSIKLTSVNIKLLGSLMNTLTKRSESIAQTCDPDQILAEFLLDLNVMYLLYSPANKKFSNKAVEKLCSTMNKHLNYLLDSKCFKLDQTLFILREILFNLSLNPLSKPSLFCELVDMEKIQNVCFKILQDRQLDTESEETESTQLVEFQLNPLLSRLNKSTYLSLVSFTLLCQLSVGHFGSKNSAESQDLKILLFKYTSNYKEIDIMFLVAFVSCFKPSNSFFMLTLSEIEFCLLIFDQLLNNSETQSIRPYLMSVLYDYSNRLLASNAYLLLNGKTKEENAGKMQSLISAQESFLKVVENCPDYESHDYSLQLALLHVRVFEIYRFQRQQHQEKRTVRNYFIKLVNAYLAESSSSTQFNLVRLTVLEKLVASAFCQFAELCVHYLYEYARYLPDDERNIKFLGCLEAKYNSEGEKAANDSDHDTFFDIIFSALIVDNKTIESTNTSDSASISSTYFNIGTQSSNQSLNTSLSSSFHTNPADKYSVYKRVFSNLRGQLDEPIYLKHFIIKMFKWLLDRQYKLYNQGINSCPKYLIKWLYGLVHIAVECKSNFTTSQLIQLVNIGYEVDILYQWMGIYVESSSSLLSAVEQSYPLQLFGHDRLEDFLKRNIHHIVTNLYFTQGQLDQDLVRLIKLAIASPASRAQFYATFLLKYFFVRDKLDGTILNKLVDTQFVKTNFFLVFEYYFTLNNESVHRKKYNKEDNLVEFTQFLVKLITGSSLESKNLLNLFDKHNCSFYVYKLLLKLNNRVLESRDQLSDLIYWINLNKSFLINVLVGNLGIIQLMQRTDQIFLIHFICRTFISCIQIPMLKLAQVAELDSDQSDLKLFFNLCTFAIEFLESVYSMFELTVQKIDQLNLYNELEYMVSSVIWHLLDFLNTSASLKHQLSILSSFNNQLIGSIIRLTSARRDSARMKRIVWFIASRERLNKFKSNFHLMTSLCQLSKNFKLESVSVDLNHEEFSECLSSEDFNSTSSHKYILSYLISQLMLIDRQDLDKELVTIMIRKSMDKMEQINQENDKIAIRNLLSTLFAQLGPIVRLDESSNNTTFSIKPLSHIKRDHILSNFDKRDSRSGSNLFTFYFHLYDSLFNNLVNSNYELQMLADKILNQIFQTSESALFFGEYRQYSEEFEASEDSQHQSTDYFLAYMKNFDQKQRFYELKDEETESNPEYTSNPVSAVFEKIDNDQIARCEYEKWLKNLVILVITSGLIRDRTCYISLPFFQRDVHICESFLPVAFRKILEEGDKVSKTVGSFLNKLFSSISSAPVTKETIKCTKTLINLIEFLRTDSIKRNKSSLFYADNQAFWDCMDFVLLAKLAQTTGMNLNSIYYAECWYNLEMSKRTNFVKEWQLEILRQNPDVIEILVTGFKSIGEVSALNSELVYLFESTKKISVYEGAQSSDSIDCIYSFDSFLNKAASTANGDESNKQRLQNARFGLVQSLKNTGLNFLLGQVMTNFENDSVELSDLKYQMSWSMGTWSSLQSVDKPTEGHSFDKTFCEILNLASNYNHQLNLVEWRDNVAWKIEECEKELKEKLLEKNEILSGSVLTQMYYLEQVRSFSVVFDSINQNDPEQLSKYFHSLYTDYTNYESKNFVPSFERHGKDKFLMLDNLLNIKVKMSSFLNELTERSDSCLTSLYECLVENAINYKSFQIGQKYLSDMRQCASAAERIKCDYIEAKLLYNKQEFNKSMFVLRNTLEEFEKSIAAADSNSMVEHVEYYLKSIDMYAQLLDETKSENPNVIIRSLLEKELSFIDQMKLGNDSKKLGLIMNSFFSIAKFADAQYQSTCEFINSSDFAEHTKLLKHFENEKSKTQSIEPGGSFHRILDKQAKLDMENIKALFQSREQHLCKAVTFYLKSLEIGAQIESKSDMNQLDNYCVFRLISLWTQNSSNLAVNSALETAIFRIATQNFLVLMHQISARINLKPANKNSEKPEDIGEQKFQKILINLIYNVAKKHPHHSLPILLAFQNAHKDETFKQTGSKAKTGDKNNLVEAEERVKAATYIVTKLKSESTKLKSIIESMSALCDAYIELANYPVTQKPKDGASFPRNLSINKIKNLTDCIILTDPAPISINDSFPHIIKFDPKFKVANGVNMPKIVNCIGSDGKTRRQLVKGKDDLRQDAILQQFFSTVNELISSHNSSQRSEITLNKVRGYKIVPLSKMSGVLEWCENTITIGDWLIGSNQDGGAHKKYEPGDWLFDECRRVLHSASPKVNSSSGSSTSSKTKKSQLEVFMEICENFKPVFRHFFTENYINVHQWYEKRLNYTKSVASASIVGYIIGLGDRHVQNILVDTSTADVIHIDLGIAFDQGKILPVPETIPFRLTRDIIDGFGACGTEGIFRNCCQDLLDLLKKSKEQITTIFEVLLYDPMHNWSLDPKKAHQLQQTSDHASSNSPILTGINSNIESNEGSQKNKIAERTLFHIKQKLLGYEKGTQLSTSGQINCLINEATDPENLSRVYAGWQPYL